MLHGFHCLTERLRGVRRTRGGAGSGSTTLQRKREEAPLNNKTKGIIKYTHWSLSVRHVLFVHFTQAALVVQKNSHW